MNKSITDLLELYTPTAKGIEFDEVYGDYWHVSYPVDLAMRKGDRIVIQRITNDATYVGTIYKREGKYYFMCQINKTSPRKYL